MKISIEIDDKTVTVEFPEISLPYILENIIGMLVASGYSREGVINNMAEIVEGEEL